MMTMKKSIGLALLFFAALVAAVPSAQARGKDNPPQPPECEVEDGGILVCK